MDPTGQSWRTIFSAGRAKSSRTLTTASLAITAVFGLGMSMAASQPPKEPSQPRPLAANDVSILFPAPRNAKDLTNLIAMSTLERPCRQRARLVGRRLRPVPGDRRKSGGRRSPNTYLPLRLPAEVKQIDAWFIAGIRIDPGAPGLSKEIIEQYGQQPQIRFIAQPVTRVRRHYQGARHRRPSDLQLLRPATRPAGSGCSACRAPKPDMAAFQPVIRDTVALRDQLASGKFGNAKVDTAGPLNVHPGLVGASAVPFRNALKGFLETHLVSARLSAMAVMGLAEPEPWIFIAMAKLPDTSGQLVFVPVPGPTLDGAQVAQMLNFRGGPQVVPAPVTNNQNPITCRHAAFQKPPQPVERTQGRGDGGIYRRQRVGRPHSGDRRHRRRSEEEPLLQYRLHQLSYRHRPASDSAWQNFKVEGVAPAVLPKEDWNVRNFGWFTSFLKTGPAVPTATRRTATETAEVVEFINRELLGK